MYFLIVTRDKQSTLFPYTSLFRSRLELLLDIFTVCAGLIALSFLMYVPFYLTFISPSQGLGVVGPADRSPLSNEILIYGIDRKSTRLNSSHANISYAVFC